MLPSQSAYLLPDTEVKHLTVLWKPGQDPSTPGTLTEPKPLFIMNWICKISTIQQQQQLNKESMWFPLMTSWVGEGLWHI